MDQFHAQEALDPYFPQYPTFINRRFDRDMGYSRNDVEQILTDFMTSQEIQDVANLVKSRLGRPLEPFDIWYDGFNPRNNFTGEELNSLVRSKYPDLNSFANDLPNILIYLGFSPEKAKEITSKITVEAARGAGEAWQSEMRGRNSHLRTHINPDGMNYEGFNIGMHEFGHNVEETLSLNDIDYYTLRGIPDDAFTEALAYSLQSRDLE